MQDQDLAAARDAVRPDPSRPIRIAAISGAIGDHAGAVRAAIHGEPVDVIIGDYMAEFTMARVIAGLITLPQPQAPTVYSYRPFLQQIAPELEAIAERGLKFVVNAGVFDPAGLADAVRAAIAERGLALKVAHTLGDNLQAKLPALVAEGKLTHLDTGQPPGPVLEKIVAANAYMGGWGIARALAEGADIVICGRVSDASLVLGPSAWWHGWRNDEWDKLAGAVAAGHLIECGAQSNGGNFAGFADLRRDLRLGYPIAEVESDGQVVITKRADEGGVVNVDTVTAQLLYEIQGPRYLNPDVILRVDTVALTQDGPDRVRMSGVKGEPPPPTTKLGCFYANGWRCSLWAFAVGLETEQKLDWLDLQMRSVADSLATLEEYRFEPCGGPVVDPQTEAEASVPVRIAAWAQDKADIARFLEGYASFALGGIPGFHGDGTKGPELRVDFWPGLVSQNEVRQQVVLDDGRVLDIPPPPMAPLGPAPAPARSVPAPAAASFGPTRKAPLGDVILARSGDKGADASLGVWCREPAAWDWVRTHLTGEQVSRLMGLRQDVVVETHEMENLKGLLFVLKGYFGPSGSGNIALDPIGKGLGEFLRARLADVPVELLEAREPAEAAG